MITAGISNESKSRNGYVFLSHQWVQEASRVIQTAKRTDKNLGKLASGLNLGLAYVITNLPKELRNHIGKSEVGLVD